MAASSQDKETAAFSQHQQQDAALQTNPSRQQQQQQQDGGISFVAKMLLYLAFPLFCGSAGLYIGYIRTIQDKQSKMHFDTDFVIPFALALALVVVVSFQTKGFSNNKITPLVQWPKVKRKRKVIRKRVLVDEDGKEIKELGKDD
jgi:hypothetical protein